MTVQTYFFAIGNICTYTVACVNAIKLASCVFFCYFSYPKDFSPSRKSVEIILTV